MAEKLSIQIALDGGAEIERQLADIGQAGQKAFADISKSAEAAGGFKKLDPKDVTTKLKEMGVTGVDAISKIQKAVQSAKNLETLVQGITSVEAGFAALARAAPLIGAAVVAAVGLAAKAMLAFAETTNKASAEAMKLGLSIEQFDQLRAGMEKAGISSEAISDGLRHVKGELDKLDLGRVKTAFEQLQEAATRGFGPQGTAQLRILEEAAKGIGPAAAPARQALEKLGQPIPAGAEEGLKRLGIEGGKLTEVIPQIIAKFQAMPDTAERTALAFATLGDKLGAELIGALRTGSAGLIQFGQAWGTLTQEQAVAAAEQQQILNQMSADWERFKAMIVAPLAGAVLGQLKAELDGIQAGIATTRREWELLKSIISAPIPPGGIVDMLRGVAQEAPKATQALQQTGQAGAQAGQQAAAGLRLVPNALTGMPQAVMQTNQALQQTGQAGAQAGQQAAQGLRLIPNALTGMPEAVMQTNQALQQIGQAAAQAGQASADAGQQATSAWGGIPAAVDVAIASVSNFASTVGTISWDAVSAGVSIWNSITSAIGRAINALLRYIGLQGSSGGGAKAPGGMAHGGLMGGRGTGTSDSNLVWLSRGEHVMPAGVVRQPGMLAFLEALRRSGGNLSRVLDRMGHFALGGLVGPMGMPAFAGGGLAGGSNVTIQFPGLPPIGGLRASSDVVDELRKAAAMAQVRSGGRKPSRYS